MDINNINGGLVTEDEQYIYFIKKEAGYHLYKMDKNTKEIHLLLNNSNIDSLSNLRIFNNKLYFIGEAISNKDEKKVGFNEIPYTLILYSLKKDGSKLTALTDKNKNLVRVIFADDIIYYTLLEKNSSNELNTAHYKHDLITNKKEMLNDFKCTLLYNATENLLCVLYESETNIYFLNKKTLAVNEIKKGLLTNTLSYNNILYINNHFYYLDNEDLTEDIHQKIKSINLQTNQQEIIFNLNDFLIDKKNNEQIVNFAIKDDFILILTNSIKQSLLNREENGQNYKLYSFKNNELIKLYEYFEKSSMYIHVNSVITFNLTEDYIFLFTTNDLKETFYIKVIDYNGNEIDI